MLLLLPVSHDSMTARRWPWVTLSLIVANFLIHTFVTSQADEELVERLSERAFEYHHRHPNLHPKAPLDMLEKQLGLTPSFSFSQTRNPKKLAEQQAELDLLCDELAAAMDALPSYSWGYAPARADVATAVSYQFLHGGWLHLIFNMWFLWLVGCYVEDAWGRWVFLAFYLVGGAFAAVAHHLSAIGSPIPLVGASGAVAAAMGAFLVKYLTTKIRFFYLFVLLLKPFWGSFRAPAAIMLPLWVLGELYSGVSGDDDGVAYFAHVGGFAFGSAVALLLKATGQEKKLDEAVEREVGSWEQDSRLLTAGAQIDRGEAAAALQTLVALAKEDPKQVDVQLERLRAAHALGDASAQADAYAAAIGAYFRQLPDKAIDLFYEAVRADRAAHVPRDLVLRMARYLVTQGEHARAANMFGALYLDGGVDAPALRALIAHGEMALSLGDHGRAIELFEHAQRAPHPHAELDTYLAQKLRVARAGGLAK